MILPDYLLDEEENQDGGGAVDEPAAGPVKKSKTLEDIFTRAGKSLL